MKKLLLILLCLPMIGVGQNTLPQILHTLSEEDLIGFSFTIQHAGENTDKNGNTEWSDATYWEKFELLPNNEWKVLKTHNDDTYKHRKLKEEYPNGRTTIWGKSGMCLGSNEHKDAICYDQSEKFLYKYNPFHKCPHWYIDGNYLYFFQEWYNGFDMHIERLFLFGKIDSVYSEISSKHGGSNRDLRFVKDKSKRGSQMHLISSYNKNFLIKFYPIKENVEWFVKNELNKWQEKGEFEKNVDYNKRVNERTRNQKAAEFEDLFIKRLMTQVKNTFSTEYIVLKEYDTENETFLLDIHPLGSLSLQVPIKEAPSFKKSFNPSFFNNIDFIIKDDKFTLSNIEYKKGFKVYKAKIF
jgi:hypothetical protein